MTYRVIAFDPGGTTGWATYTAERIWDHELNQWLYSKEKWACGYLDGNHHQRLKALLELQRVETYRVVYERFVQRKGNKGGLDIALEYETTIRVWCEEERIDYCPKVTSSKKFTQDANLKRLGLWSPGRKNRHSMDAFRHLCHYLCIDCQREDILAIGWPK